jgi:general stress protein YciG
MNDAEKVRSVTGERKERRGFASMSPEKQREIASKGGRAAHQKGTAHEWTSEEARSAGRKGGQISRGGRGRLVETPEGTIDELTGVPGDPSKFDTSSAREGAGPQ